MGTIFFLKEPDGITTGECFRECQQVSSLKWTMVSERLQSKKERGRKCLCAAGWVTRKSPLLGWGVIPIKSLAALGCLWLHLGGFR